MSTTISFCLSFHIACTPTSPFHFFPIASFTTHPLLLSHNPHQCSSLLLSSPLIPPSSALLHVANIATNVNTNKPAHNTMASTACSFCSYCKLLIAHYLEVIPSNRGATYRRIVTAKGIIMDKNKIFCCSIVYKFSKSEGRKHFFFHLNYLKGVSINIG